MGGVDERSGLAGLDGLDGLGHQPVVRLALASSLHVNRTHRPNIAFLHSSDAMLALLVPYQYVK